MTLLDRQADGRTTSLSRYRNANEFKRSIAIRYCLTTIFCTPVFYVHGQSLPIFKRVERCTCREKYQKIKYTLNRFKRSIARHFFNVSQFNCILDCAIIICLSYYDFSNIPFLPIDFASPVYFCQPLQCGSYSKIGRTCEPFFCLPRTIFFRTPTTH